MGVLKLFNLTIEEWNIELINFDKKYRDEFRYSYIAGTDEAGRGPLAGPVVAAAVVFDADVEIKGVRDSKKLSKKERERLFIEICDNALSVKCEIVSADKIDEINILNASLLAMKNAVEALDIQPDAVLIDGNKQFLSKIPTFPIVQGDDKSFSIAAASIVAKVVRDRIMTNLSREYPNYHWETNKGYPTKAHFKAIKEHGITIYHRKTFLKKLLDGEQTEIFE